MNQLEGSDFRILGRMRNASNSTLVGSIDGQQVIYKPISGERPLWDFPDETLALRERAAYVASELLGWKLVPLTILRDGPEGPGSVQQWIDGEGFVADIFSPDSVPSDWLTIVSGFDENNEPVILAHAPIQNLARIAVFDALINNADRKAGHIISAHDGTLYAIDHGVTFHHENKLRTVLWGWIDQEIDRTLIADVEKFIGLIDDSELSELLTDVEISALKYRANELVARPKFPEPNPHWPAIPWPVF